MWLSRLIRLLGRRDVDDDDDEEEEEGKGRNVCPLFSEWVEDE